MAATAEAAEMAEAAQIAKEAQMTAKGAAIVEAEAVKIAAGAAVSKRKVPGSKDSESGDKTAWSDCYFCLESLQPLIPPKLFDIFSFLTGGRSEGLGAFRFFFKTLGIPKPLRLCHGADHL